jgi:hypothetical protein
MARIKVLDALCGQGKTSYMIQKMNRENRKWLYICPYLDEVERIITECPERDFYQPKGYQKDNKKFNKSDSLYELVEKGVNITSTHELFKDIDSETGAELKRQGYTLVMDEVMEIVEPLPFSQNQIQALFDRGFLSVKEIDDNDRLLDKSKVKRVIAGSEDRLDDLYLSNFKSEALRLSTLKDYADRNRLVWVSNAVLVWLFPSSLLNAFKEVYNLTYLFDGSYQKYYYDLHGMEFDTFSVVDRGDRDYKLVKYHRSNDLAKRNEIRKLINIYEGDRNVVGDDWYSLSYNWWNPQKSRKLPKKKALKIRKRRETKMANNTRDYFRTVLKVASKFVMWTCFKDKLASNHNGKGRKKDNNAQITPNGYASKWIPFNQRATNEYYDRKHLAYLCNVFIDPDIIKYFSAFNYPVKTELYALSELVQWIFRSALRNGKPIDIYIPSRRMRGLLKAWVNNGLEAYGSVEPITK